jgi:arylsulfate sulfotransferase
VSKNPVWQKYSRYSSVLLLVLIAGGCGGGYQMPAPQPLTISITPATAALGTGQSMPFAATGDSGGVTWSVSSAAMGAAGSAGTIDASGNYTAPSGAQSVTAIVKATSKTNPIYSSSVSINVVAPGLITPTNNVQVAQYTISPAASANVSVQFGLDTSYGLTTWTQPTPAAGGSVSLFVAGMKQSTPYHMRGVVAFADGSAFNDADQTFTTGALPTGTVPNITASTSAGMTPQPGVEVLDLINLTASTLLTTLVSDLNGNVIWTYNPGSSVPTGSSAQPIKLLPNGHFLITWTVSDSHGEASSSVLQEVDLGSNVIWSMTSAQLNTALAAATCAECNVTILGMHHDIAILPNGHFVTLANTQQTIAGTVVTGDVVIDLGDMSNVGGNNPTHSPQPTWAWNEFNHLDTNRRPYMYPDWTHTNAVIFSKDDNNLIISIRHQNWLVKIDYNNGTGTGDILWKLGAKLPSDTGQNVADFTLMNADGTADANQEDWFFAQHAPSFVSSNTTGKFSLVLFDNGDDRGVVDVVGGTCNAASQPNCFSTTPILQIDETAKTATLAFNPTTPNYSFFGGNAEVLANGNVEFDEAASTAFPAENASIFEITQSGTPQTVWQMHIAGQYAYRGMRIPSLYPGVQW